MMSGAIYEGNMVMVVGRSGDLRDKEELPEKDCGLWKIVPLIV